jgi:hypothetical protein
VGVFPRWKLLEKTKGKQETGIFSIKTGRAIKPERAITERN